MGKRRQLILLRTSARLNRTYQPQNDLKEGRLMTSAVCTQPKAFPESEIPNCGNQQQEVSGDCVTVREMSAELPYHYHWK